MRYFYFVISLLCAMASAFSASAEEKISTYSLNVGRFDKINVVDDANVVFRCSADSTGYVMFRTTPKMADAYIFTNPDGCLKIQVDTREIDDPDLPVIYVYSDFLTSAVSSSAYSLRVEGNMPVPKFSAKLIGNGELIATGINATQVDVSLMTGNGTIVIDGITSKANFRVVGTGLINADALKAEAVSCNFMGGGTLGCWAEKTLDTRGIGTTRVYYKGEPKIKKVGGGKIYPLSSESKRETEEDE